MGDWNLPPGVTNRMIDEYAGVYDEEETDYCWYCGLWLDDADRALEDGTCAACRKIVPYNA